MTKKTTAMHYVWGVAMVYLVTAAMVTIALAPWALIKYLF